MKIIDINTLRNIFLDLLDETKYNLINEGQYEVEDIKFGDDINDNNHNLIFTEYGFYNEAINQVPETEEELMTPGIFAYDGADIINNPSYEAYNEMIAFEFLGFEKQRKGFRKLLERFAADIRGKTMTIYWDNSESKYVISPESFTMDNGDEKYTAIISTEMPNFSETIDQSGYERFQAYINMDFTVMSGIQLSDNIEFKIDNEVIPVSSLVIERNKTNKAFNVRTKETESYAENQAISINITGLLKDSSPASLKIKNAILSPDYLNTAFEISFEGYNYKMYLSKGSLNMTYGSGIEYNASFSTLKEL